MNIKIYFAICFLSLLSWALHAQNGNNGNVGIGTITPDSSAMLDISSENKGLLVPHVTLVTIDDSTSPIMRPANGLLVYHIGDNDIEMGFYYWNGHEWVGLCSCPTAAFGVQILPSSTQICNGNSITLQANVTPRNGNYRYKWSNDETTASINVTPSVSTTYTVTVNDNDNDHSAIMQTTVTVYDNPTVTITPSSATTCPSVRTDLTADGSGGSGSGYTYLWSENSATGPVISVSPSVSSTYTVTVTDGNGCSSTDTSTVNIRNFLEGINSLTVISGNDTVSFNMVAVHGGEFLMGTQDTNSNGLNYENEGVQSNEKPVHIVTLSDYAIGETEVTQALWLAVMGTWPQTSHVPNDTYGVGRNHPAYFVSWNNICNPNGFLDKLNNLLKDSLCGMHFALPTEEQWEFAAAGGSEGYNPDGSRKYKFSGTNDTAQLRNYANYNYNNSPGKTIAVKSKLRNQLGLYDMSGNVWEWCKNLLYDYPPGSRIYTSGVLRGGGYGGNANGCRVAFRSANNHDAGGGVYGFRLALVQE